MLLNKLPPGVCWRGGGGGGGNRLAKIKEGGASKQQAVEFPQVLTSTYIIICYNCGYWANPEIL